MITIVKIVLLICTASLLFHIIKNILIVFCDHFTEEAAKSLLESPIRYIRDEEMCKFFRNMLYLFITLHLLYGIFSDKLEIKSTDKTFYIRTVQKKGGEE